VRNRLFDPYQIKRRCGNMVCGMVSERGITSSRAASTQGKNGETLITQ
jgi:hypothetical protein